MPTGRVNFRSRAERRLDAASDLTFSMPRRPRARNVSPRRSSGSGSSAQRRVQPVGVSLPSSTDILSLN